MEPDITSRLPRRNNRPAVGDVRLVREIGRGGVGVVYAGWHDGRNAPCAVKFLLDPEVASADRLARFEREARLCIEIEEPALVRVFETGRVGGLPYFVMEWVPGNGLDVVAGAVGRLTESEVMTVLRDVGQALAGLHSRNIVHRDIKPSNLLLRATDGRLKVADLGMAKRVGAADAVRTVEIIGTPSYMSPEQVRDSAGVGPASDYFSLGSTAYALLTGQHPFDADNPYDSMRLVCETPLARPPADEVRVSDGLWRVIERLTVKDPAARVQTPAQLMDLLPGCRLRSARRSWRRPGRHTKSSGRMILGKFRRCRSRRPRGRPRTRPSSLLRSDRGGGRRYCSASACRTTFWPRRTGRTGSRRTCCTSAGRRRCESSGPTRRPARWSGRSPLARRPTTSG